MTEAQAQLLARARESIEAAKYLLEGGYPGFAASRAYYAMFYAAEALLEGEGRNPSGIVALDCCSPAVPGGEGDADLHFAATMRICSGLAGLPC